MNDTPLRALVVSRASDTLTTAITRQLRQTGWHVELGDAALDGRLTAIVYLTDLLESAQTTADPAQELRDLVSRNLTRLRRDDDSGARIVSVTSRDWLGSAADPSVAAKAAAVVAMSRSLALAHGRERITSNTVVGLAPSAGDPTRPRPLGSHTADEDAIARAVAFFIDPRSSYITGQTMHCTGGASLLSSLSV